MRAFGSHHEVDGPGSVERRLSNRVADDVNRFTSLLSDELTPAISTRDLHVLHNEWDLTPVPPSLAGPVGLARRMLHRLLFPTFQRNSRYTAANSRVVLELVNRIGALERAIRELESRAATPESADPGSSGSPRLSAWEDDTNRSEHNPPERPAAF